MDEVFMAFGNRFEPEAVGTVVEISISGKSTFFSARNLVCFRLRLRCIRKATKPMNAMSATPPPTAPPIMALVEVLEEEVFLFHGLVLCPGFQVGGNKVVLTSCSNLKNLDKLLVLKAEERPLLK
jgi:hypothetical protein